MVCTVGCDFGAGCTYDKEDVLMKKAICLIILSLCLLITACGNVDTEGSPSTPASSFPETVVPETSILEPKAPELSQRVQDWTNDFNYLKRHYKMYHIDSFYYCSEEEFNWKLDQLAAKADDLSDSDIYFELVSIMAGMGDSHTTVTPPEYIYENYFPLGVRYFDDKLYLSSYLEGYEQFEPYLLREIVAVNGIDMAYLTKKFEDIICPANTWNCRADVRYYFPSFFDWAGCDYQQGYVFQFLNENQEVESVAVPIVSFENAVEGTWVTSKSLETVFYLKGGNWSKYFEEENGSYIYMSFSEMSSPIKSSYKELFEKANELIAAHPDCDKLVIDLRLHPGGTSLAIEYVQEYAELLKSPAGKHTYVITGGYTASAAINCISIFKEELDAVTVGEPTGQFVSFFCGTSANKSIVLPLSQLSISVSTLRWEVPNLTEVYYGKEGKLYEWENTILPDVFIYQNIEDIRQGKDSVIEWVLAQ